METWVSQASLAVLLLSCLISFAWAMGRFFVKPSGMTAGMRLTAVCGFAFSAIHLGTILLARHIALVPAIIGAAMYLMALGVFWWAIAANRQQPLSACFSPDEPSHLMQRGPYRYIRHPFYCSYLLTWSAGLVATGSLLLAITVLVMLGIYLNAAIAEERKFSLGPLAEAYQQYRTRTGLFIPNPFKLLAARRSS